MCWGGKVDMELLAEFTASRSPNYRHGTPDGVQHSKYPNSSHQLRWWDLAKNQNPTLITTGTRARSQAHWL